MRGAVVKNYEVWGRLSGGGMSDVWLARHRDLALPVIIKTLHTGGEDTFESRYARLLSEAQLAARLTSPRIVRVIDVGVYTDPFQPNRETLPFLVEEYVDGIDLGEFDRRRRQALRRPLPLWIVADQIAQAAEGLHAAHQAGVIHRDVKPSNLFGYGHAHIKVGDFGVAVCVASRDAAIPAGTPAFMAPEHILGESVDRRADIYSLGATAFALRYGQTPFESAGDSVRGEVGPRFPLARSPEEAYFQHVLAKMMAHRPQARYANLMIVRHHLYALAQATAPRLVPSRIGEHEVEIGGVRVIFEVGDLSTVESEALVNSAQSDMSMRSGVGDALRRRGGDEIEAQAVAGGERALGECIATRAGALSARGVLHAVGGWNEVSCVARAMHRVLLTAEELGFTRIALPAIGTGVGRVALEACADAMLGALRLHVSLGGSRLREVRFVLFDPPTFRRFTDVALGLLYGTEESIHYDDDIDAPASHDDSTTSPTLFATASDPAQEKRSPTERLPRSGE